MQWADRFVELHPELSPVDRAVLTRLAYRANPTDGQAFPGLERLVAETGFGRTAIKAAVARLRELLPIERRPGGGIVWIFPADPTAGMSLADHAELSPGGHETTPRAHAKLSPGGRLATKGGHVATPRGSRGDPKPKGTKTEPAPAPFVTRPHVIERERAMVEDVETREPVAVAMPPGGWRDYKQMSDAYGRPRSLMETLTDGDPDEIVDSPLDLRYAMMT